MGDGKAVNVIEYLDNLIEKGKASIGAIRPLKIAFTKVVQTIDGDNWRMSDVRSIDVDDYMARFANLTMGKYSADSLAAYKSRMNKAVTWYLQFLDKPGWTPDVQRRNRVPKTTLESVTQQRTVEANSSATPSVVSHDEKVTPLPSQPDHILYPYPLSDGHLIHISLPVQLSKHDAKRIGAFIESIAVDTPPPTEPDR